MSGASLSRLAFAVTLWQAREGLGRGVSVLACVGFFYGFTRANYPDGLTHFIFDAALAGLYVAVLRTPGPSPLTRWAEGRALQLWVRALMGWPFVMLLLSPLLPSQPFLVQLVGLRGAVLMVPMLLVGARLGEQDLDVLGRTLVWLTLAAFATALAQVVLGVERFFPENATTAIIYASQDVGEGEFRIPSLFMSAHAYGGTMLLTMPLLVRQWLRGSGFGARRLAAGASVLACAVGLFLCGARSPVVQMVMALVLLVLSVRPSLKLVAGLALGALLVGVVVARNPRLQRFATLSDTEGVEQRVAYSLNTSGLLDVLVDDPLGRGLASAGGTSVPFFLAHLARPQLFLENEYARITMEQGLIGLLLWLGFLVWALVRRPPARPGQLPVAVRLPWALCVVAWGTAFLGTGTLLAIPGTVLLLILMGGVVRAHAPAPAEVRAPVRAAPAADRALLPARPVRLRRPRVP